MRIFIFTLSLLLLTACYSAPQVSTPPPGFPEQSPQYGESCGGMTGSRCSNPNEYCAYTQQAQCGAADQMGTCSPRPQMCTSDYTPVCGCNGKTYSNACTAAGAGISIVHAGQCRN
ncbi:MAG: serine protease [Robiginitomaculum sp.]|nr:MAG: serine protease [Robiginitomaculum sp.]